MERHNLRLVVEKTEIVTQTGRTRIDEIKLNVLGMEIVAGSSLKSLGAIVAVCCGAATSRARLLELKRLV